MKEHFSFIKDLKLSGSKCTKISTAFSLSAFLFSLNAADSVAGGIINKI